MDDASHPLLCVSGLTAGYGAKVVLDAVDLTVGSGEVVAVIGHNAAGKSTLLRTIFGLHPVWSGSVTLAGVTEAQRRRPQCLLRCGIAYLPQGTPVFRDLTVEENLQLALDNVQHGTSGADTEDVLNKYADLVERRRQRAGALSGGEKQLLGFAMAMATRPRLLLLDEPLAGLGAKAAEAIARRIRDTANRHRTGVLLVEHRVRVALGIADRACVLQTGRVSYAGPAAALLEGDGLRQWYLG